MDATEPNPSESSPPRSGVEMASEHWVCPECGTYDGPIAGRAYCDHCADGSEVYRVVPREDAEALAHAVSACLAPNPHPFAANTLVTALTEYLAKHPWSDL